MCCTGGSVLDAVVTRVFLSMDDVTIPHLSPTLITDTDVSLCFVRLEWVPGKGGHLRWYIDNVEVMGIDAPTVEKHGTQVYGYEWYVFVVGALRAEAGVTVRYRVLVSVSFLGLFSLCSVSRSFSFPALSWSHDDFRFCRWTL